MKWYTAAAEQGHAGAQNRLGVMYAEGQGTARDYGKAVQWYQRSAEQGDAAAQFNLGMVYAQGQGVPRDNAKAYFWYNLAAMELGGDAAKRRDETAQKLDRPGGRTAEQGSGLAAQALIASGASCQSASLMKRFSWRFHGFMRMLHL